MNLLTPDWLQTQNYLNALMMLKMRLARNPLHQQMTMQWPGPTQPPQTQQQSILQALNNLRPQEQGYVR